MIVQIFFSRNIVDLADEHGTIKYLALHPYNYANEYITSRDVLVLLSVESKTNYVFMETSTYHPIQHKNTY